MKHLIELIEKNPTAFFIAAAVVIVAFLVAGASGVDFVMSLGE